MSVIMDGHSTLLLLLWCLKSSFTTYMLHKRVVRSTIYGWMLNSARRNTQWKVSVIICYCILGIYLYIKIGNSFFHVKACFLSLLEYLQFGCVDYEKTKQHKCLCGNDLMFIFWWATIPGNLSTWVYTVFEWT